MAKGQDVLAGYCQYNAIVTTCTVQSQITSSPRVKHRSNDRHIYGYCLLNTKRHLAQLRIVTEKDTHFLLGPSV
jgi:hypothetical protein